MAYKPNNCLVVEDSELGILAAEAANMPSILYDPSENYSSRFHSPKINSMSQLRNEITT